MENSDKCIEAEECVFPYLLENGSCKDNDPE